MIEMFYEIFEKFIFSFINLKIFISREEIKENNVLNIEIKVLELYNSIFHNILLSYRKKLL